MATMVRDTGSIPVATVWGRALVVTPENCENPSDESTDTAAFSRGKVRTKTEQLGDGHKSSTFPANQGAREPAATPLDIPTLVGHTMRKVQRLNVGGRKLKI